MKPLLHQIQANLATKTCPVTTSLLRTNATPVVAAVSNYTIPISTPFALTGSATDADAGDVLTYCWEQNDNSTVSGASSVASATKASGPNWISFSPTASPTRYFPKLSTILAGLNITPVITGGDAGTNIEALSSVSRTLNFRLTVRDNAPYSSTAPVRVGQTQFTDMVVTVTNTSGPFAITAPNTAVSYVGGSTQTITWSVASTTAAPVSCANVKISLSTDGGQTFPTVLAASTANDGTEALVIPNTATTTARIKVEAVGNIFFDISNSNFTITAPVTGFSFNSVAPATVACGGATSVTSTLATTATGGFSTPINLSATGNPAGTTVSFSTNPLNPGSSSDITITGVNTLAPGTYPVTVNGLAGAISQSTTVSFTVQPGTPPAITTQPAAVSNCAGDNAVFTVASSTPGVTYQWQVNTGSGFANVTTGTGGNTATYTVATAQGDNGNQYQCIISYLCGTSTSSAASLTVNTAANITTQPAAHTACEGENHTFSVVATGTNISYQWQVSTGGPFTNITGATNSSYTITGITNAMNGNQYQVVISSSTSACPAPGVSNTVTLTVNPLPVVTASADLASVCTGSSVVLSATGAASYAWTPGAATGSPITVNPAVLPSNPSVPNTITYTVTGTSLGCSSTATVDVTANPLPTVTLTADPAITTLTLPSQVVTLTANVNPPGSSYTYDWTQNGNAISNNTNTLTADVLHAGEYAVTVSVNGTCASTSNSINIIDSVADRFYVYPNPNNGQFVIQLRNPNVVGNVTVFDSRGSRIAKINVTKRTPYQVISVDLNAASAGTYVLAIYDKAVYYLPVKEWL